MTDQLTDSLTDQLLELIHTQKTLVLATSDPQPWAAPLYYLYRGRRFYFFSAPHSRHVTAGLAAGQCAAAIYRDGDDWREIEGVQMEGHLERIPLGLSAARVFTAYVRKFPTVKDLFADSVRDLAAFVNRARSQLYAFVPRNVYYLNNRLIFAERREVVLPE